MTAINALSPDVELTLLVGALNAQDAQIALADAAGRLIFSNQPWVNFFESHPSLAANVQGAAGCLWMLEQLVAATAAEDAAGIHRLRDVFTGREKSAAADLECRSCAASHWLRVSARWS